MNTPDIALNSGKKQLTTRLISEFNFSLLSASRAAEYMIQTQAEPYYFVSELPDCLWVKSHNPEGKSVYIILCVSISWWSENQSWEYQVSTIHSQEWDPKILNNTGVVVNSYLLRLEEILSQESN